MAEELTTAMHEELIGKDVPHLDIQEMGVYGAIRRGLPKQEALAQYQLSEVVYDENIGRVLKT